MNVNNQHADNPVVAQVGKYYAPETGGIENNVHQLAHACSKQFRSVVVCMRKKSGPQTTFSDHQVAVTLLKSYGAIWRQEIVVGCHRVLREYQPDIVHFHTPNPLLAFQVWRYVRSFRCRLVVSHHADLHRPEMIRKFANQATRKLLDRADKIVSYTKTFAQSSRELRSHQQKIALLPHGISLPPQGAPDPRLTIQGDTLKVGFLGRIEKWKGLDILLDVIAGEKNIDLIIGGKGGYWNQLKKKVDALQFQHRVHFLGRVTGQEKEDFFRSIDVLVLPSLNTGESYGQVLVEAQLRGLPVISSNLPTGVREICDFGDAGLLFKPGSVNELTKCLKDIQDPATFSRLARTGQSLAMKRFSEPVVWSQIPELYKNLLS